MFQFVDYHDPEFVHYLVHRQRTIGGVAGPRQYQPTALRVNAHKYAARFRKWSERERIDRYGGD